MIFNNIEERYQDPDFWTGKLQLELYRLIKNHLEETGISQNEFARRIGVSKGYMSQVLNGNFDHKLSKLVSLALATGKVPQVKYQSVETVIQLAKGEYAPIEAAYVSPVQSVEIKKTLDNERATGHFRRSLLSNTVPGESERGPKAKMSSSLNNEYISTPSTPTDVIFKEVA